MSMRRLARRQCRSGRSVTVHQPELSARTGPQDLPRELGKTVRSRSPPMGNETIDPKADNRIEPADIQLARVSAMHPQQLLVARGSTFHRNTPWL